MNKKDYEEYIRQIKWTLFFLDKTVKELEKVYEIKRKVVDTANLSPTQLRTVEDLEIKFNIMLRELNNLY